MQKDNFSVHGAVTLVLQRKDGACIASRHNNMVLNSGIDFLCNAFGAGSARPNVMDHIAVGTGTTATTAGDTKLVSELLRKAASYSHSAGTTKLTVQATFNAGEATGAITEAGICNASSDGTFFDRVTFPVISKGASDVLTVTFEITLTRA
jgi:hypothetical protein|nr:MAG TPA: tail-collar fiber protein [Bacteriophage sp.]